MHTHDYGKDRYIPQVKLCRIVPFQTEVTAEGGGGRDHRRNRYVFKKAEGFTHHQTVCQKILIKVKRRATGDKFMFGWMHMYIARAPIKTKASSDLYMLDMLR